MSLPIPDKLERAVRSGNCVAFVGAGFSAACVLPWGPLLKEIASRAAPNVCAQINTLLEKPGEALSYEAAAQTLQQALGRKTFAKRLRDAVGAPTISPMQQRRIDYLKGIPFRGILTTNFDPLLSGDLPCSSAYRDLLRPKDGVGWHQERYWTDDGPTVVKLHGDVHRPESVVLTRRGYRQLLYGNSSYATFLRSVFATNTVLFLGCSFSDFYIVELRSEILALFDHAEDHDPISYAVVADATPERVAFFKEHEGLELLSYDSREKDEEDHGAFDDFLARLFRKTNPLHYLGELLRGKRMLWHDPNPQRNEWGIERLRQAAALSGAHFVPPDEVHDVEHALKLLGEQDYDLVLSHWGYRKGGPSNAERLLGQMRQRDVHAPVIVFATAEHADDNKRRALRAGAVDYVFSWPTLMRRIARLLEPGKLTG